MWFITIASFSVKHTYVKVISIVLENISRSPCTIHRHGGDQNERILHALELWGAITAKIQLSLFS